MFLGSCFYSFKTIKKKRGGERKKKKKKREKKRKRENINNFNLPW